MAYVWLILQKSSASSSVKAIRRHGTLVGVLVIPTPGRRKILIIVTLTGMVPACLRAWYAQNVAAVRRLQPRQRQRQLNQFARVLQRRGPLVGVLVIPMSKERIISTIATRTRMLLASPPAWYVQNVAVARQPRPAQRAMFPLAWVTRNRGNLSMAHAGLTPETALRETFLLARLTRV